MNFYMCIQQYTDALLGWPLMLYVMGIGLLCTIAYKGIQFTYFFKAWKAMFAPTEGDQLKGQMTPFQAFINTLSTNLGNGSIAGAATAVYAGGPGAALWIVIFGIILMAVRFAEVYISTYFAAEIKHEENQGSLGGPMLYLQKLPGGSFLPVVYAALALLFGLLGGSAMQMNSIQLSIYTTWGISPYITATFLTLFMLYVVYGGSSRVIAVSDMLVPVKVIVFCIASIILLALNAAHIPAALALIIKAAFSYTAVAGGLAGFTVKQAIQYGMARSIFATESGLGTAAILFGFTGSVEPVKDGIIAMLSTFISALVCFIVALCIVVTGVWDSGATSTALTIQAFSQVFGVYGGWIVSFLSATFGIGVAVSYVYVVRSVWMYLTKDRYEDLFKILYCAFAFWGSLVCVDQLWACIDIANASMLAINMFAMLYFVPLISTRLKEYARAS